MANELLKQNYQDIADAIRSKTGNESTITPNSMPSEIENIETVDNLNSFTPDTTKYYRSSTGYTAYYRDIPDMEECSGELFEKTASVNSGSYYQVESSAIIGYDGSNPLEEASGAFYAQSMEITSSFYQAASSGYLGYDGDNPLESVNSFSINQGAYYLGQTDTDLVGDEYALSMISSKTLTNGALYMGLGKEFGYDITLGYPTEELSIELFTMEVNDSQSFSVEDNGVTKNFIVTRIS